MKLPMILLWKAVVLEVGVQGLQAQPKKFWLAENLGKSPENPGKNIAQHCLTSKNGAQALHKNTWRPFFGGYTKKRSSWSSWEKIWRQKLLKKLFEKVWENPGKILRTPKICLLLHLWWKGTSVPGAPLLERQRGIQARNQLGTPGVAKIFLRGVHIF